MATVKKTATKTTRKKKIVKKNIEKGRAYINASFNNTLVTITDAEGNTIVQNSAGAQGFKGSRKSTPFAAQQAAEAAAKVAYEHGVRKVDIVIKGAGNGRESSLRAFQVVGIDILSITDDSPIPHNGCRPPKARRL